jgi:hypothetical protein
MAVLDNIISMVELAKANKNASHYVPFYQQIDSIESQDVSRRKIIQRNDSCCKKRVKLPTHLLFGDVLIQ